MTTYSTATNTHTPAITLHDLLEMQTRVRKLMAELPTEWMLVSPNGDMYKGTPEEMISVLMPHHHLMKQSPLFVKEGL